MSSNPPSSSTKASPNRWWHVEKDGQATAKKPDSTFAKPRPQRISPETVLCTKWQFKVFVSFDLLPSERVALTGSCDQLGNWMPNESISLTRIEGRLPNNSYIDCGYCPPHIKSSPC